MSPCRLCLSEDDNQRDIFNEEDQLHFKIKTCLTLQISQNDSLPRKICEACTLIINKIYAFYNKAKESENSLLNIPTFAGSRVVKIERSSSCEFLNETTQMISKFTQTDGISRDDSEPIRDDLMKEMEIKVEPEDCFDSSCVPIEFVPTKSDFNADLLVEVRTVETEAADCSSNSNIKRKDLSVCEKNKCIPIKNNNLKTVSPVKKTIKKKDLSPKIKKSKLESNSGTSPNNKKNSKLKEPCRVWQCLVCFLLKSTRTELFQHYEEHIEYQSEYKKMNGIKLESTNREECQNFVTVEVKEFSDESAYQCLQCSKMFINADLVTKHVESHNEDILLPCNSCGDTFQTPDDILNHGVEHSKRKLYVCRYKFCDYSTEYCGVLLSHQQKFDHIYKFVCKICQKGFDTLYWYTEHQTVHSGVRPYACDACDKAFRYSRQLVTHRKTEHPEKSVPLPRETYRCDECGLDYFHPKQLARHHIWMHTFTQVICDICKKVLSSKAHLKKHLKIHSGEKSFVCRFCKKRFVHKWNLKTHERIHSGERPYTCSYCKKSYTQKSTLVIHERYHTGDRPYQCEVCSKAFVAKGLLSMHQKTCS